LIVIVDLMAIQWRALVVKSCWDRNTKARHGVVVLCNLRYGAPW
jgi:hypothetical protein